MSEMYAISFDKPLQLVRLTWKDGTAAMDDEDFRHTLEVFAEAAKQHAAKRAIIDVRAFRHRPSREILAWRDEVTVRRYNEAGIVRQAWIWPGETPSMKPSSAAKHYVEKYCSTAEEADAWIVSEDE